MASLPVCVTKPVSATPTVVRRMCAHFRRLSDTRSVTLQAWLQQLASVYMEKAPNEATGEQWHYGSLIPQMLHADARQLIMNLSARLRHAVGNGERGYHKPELLDCCIE